MEAGLPGGTTCRLPGIVPPRDGSLDPFEDRAGDLIHLPIKVIHPFRNERELALLPLEFSLQVIDGLPETADLLHPVSLLPLELLSQTFDAAFLPCQRLLHNPEVDHHLGRERDSGSVNPFCRLFRCRRSPPGSDLPGDLFRCEALPGEFYEFPDNPDRFLREESDRADGPAGKKAVVSLDECPDVLLGEPGEVRDIADLQFLLAHDTILCTRSSVRAVTLL